MWDISNHIGVSRKKMYVRTVDLKSDINVTFVIDNQLKLTPIDVEAR